jgi:hypothetical protein
MNRTSIVLLAVFGMQSQANAQCIGKFTDPVYGFYTADDGGLYHVRQIGNDVWWVGISSDGGRSFMNVFHGQRNGNTLTGGWLDVPGPGEAFPTHAGQIKLQISDANTVLKKVKLNPDTSPRATNWNRMPCPPEPTITSQLQLSSASSRHSIENGSGGRL